MTTRDGQSFTWDEENRLTGISDTIGGYSYDGMNRVAPLRWHPVKLNGVLNLIARSISMPGRMITLLIEVI